MEKYLSYISEISNTAFNIQSEWNGDESGLSEDRAMCAKDIQEKCKELEELLKELNEL